MPPIRPLPPPAARGSWLAALLVSLLVVAAIPSLSGPALGSHDDDPRFEITVPEATLSPGTTQELTVQLVNDHEEVDETVETARNVRATMGPGDTSIEVESGTKVVGDLPDGVVTPVTFRIRVPRNIEAGTHRLPVRLDYEFDEDDRGTSTVTAQVRVRDRARFAVVSTEADLSVGETGQVNVTIENVGSAGARDASVSLESASAAVSIGSSAADTRYVGTWAPGERKTVAYDVSVATSADAQRYALTARVDFEDVDGNAVSSGALSTGFTPRPEQRFAVREVDSTLQVGREGVVSGRIENLGPKTARNAVVVLSPANPTLTPRETEYSIGTIEPGGTADFRFPIAMSDDAGAGPRQLSVRVRYRDRNDDEQRTDEIDVTAPVAAEQTFAATDTTSTLRVGREGTLSGTIVNEGPTAVRNAVVVFESSRETVNPVETEYAVGDLAPGDGAPFSFDVEISEAADAGPRLFTVRVRYRDTAGDVSTSDTIDVAAEVGPKRDVFDVEPVDATIQAGTGGTLTVRVTNAGSEPVSDVSAKLFANAPLGTADDEAFVDRLEPGESAEIVFGLSASGSALEKTYPVSIDFQYDDEEGDTLLSDTYQLPVRVVEPSGGGGPPLLLIGGVLVVALVVAGGVYRYRLRGR